ncbi:hypothetical protein LWC34_55305 [Kibdelosporangium philippinense]|uniref:Uncharacterized protein n=1 Tax=Kibdelosporangium philippinense TaxID=211113 RepID=A0ABS8ZX61_9PSEU|nr:hypothetical protein [Kibdelosporangium philippinense]MCE7011923.1 hypothetical protein [Kibdelosporangium philippinense]
MSWTDYYERRNAIDSILVRAERDPAGPLPTSAAFADPVELLLALHYRWTLKLTGRLGMVLAEADGDPSIDLVDAISDAWRKTVAENATLYAVLDAHADRYEALWPQLQAEQRTLALAAGLAETHEATEEITRVGAAFQTLLRTAEKQSPRRRSPVEQLIRRLVASA